MPNYHERERRMSMLRAALPYTVGNQRHALEMLLQINTLINTARRGPENDLEACDTDAKPEEMLLQIQEYCTPRESDTVQMILNFMKASHLFQNYREFMAARPENHPSGDVQAAGYSKNTSSNHLMEFLITQLPAEQRQMLEQLQSLSEAGMFAQNPDTPATADSAPSYSNDESGQYSSGKNEPPPMSDLAAAEVR